MDNYKKEIYNQKNLDLKMAHQFFTKKLLEETCKLDRPTMLKLQKHSDTLMNEIHILRKRNKILRKKCEELKLYKEEKEKTLLEIDHNLKRLTDLHNKNMRIRFELCEKIKDKLKPLVSLLKSRSSGNCSSSIIAIAEIFSILEEIETIQ